MKVFLVWYSDPYNPVYDVLKVFDTEEKAQKYINNCEYKDEKENLFIDEKEVE